MHYIINIKPANVLSGRLPGLTKPYPLLSPRMTELLEKTTPDNFLPEGEVLVRECRDTERPYECGHCGKSFSLPSSLRYANPRDRPLLQLFILPWVCKTIPFYKYYRELFAQFFQLLSKHVFLLMKLFDIQLSSLTCRLCPYLTFI